jgi:GH24 family phage-related lysozyme (muramidase)
MRTMLPGLFLSVVVGIFHVGNALETLVDAPRHGAANKLAVDSHKNVFACGTTRDNLDGNTNHGQDDAFLSKYSTDGTRLWTKLFGSAEVEKCSGLAVDSHDNVYIAGCTEGNVGGANVGICDVYLLKIDGSTGTVIFASQLGTNDDDIPVDIALDHTPQENVYITGYTYGPLAGLTPIGRPDGFLLKFSSTTGAYISGRLFGAPQPASQDRLDDDSLNSGHTHPIALAIDNTNNIFITGQFTGMNFLGQMTHGKYDIFLMKINAAGSIVFTRAIGSPENDQANGLALDVEHNLVYITGYSKGSLPNTPNHGTRDILLVKCNADNGNVILHKLWGTTSNDIGYEVVINPNKYQEIFITGFSYDGLNAAGNGLGDTDAFLIIYDSNTDMVTSTELLGPSSDFDGAFAMLFIGSGPSSMTTGRQNLRTVTAVGDENNNNNNNVLVIGGYKGGVLIDDDTDLFPSNRQIFVMRKTPLSSGGGGGDNTGGGSNPDFPTGQPTWWSSPTTSPTVFSPEHPDDHHKCVYPCGTAPAHSFKKTSANGMGLIKHFETFSMTCYREKGEDFWRIGYGHACETASDNLPQYGVKCAKVKTCSGKLTKAQAEDVLKKDIKEAENFVRTQLKNILITQNQFDALVSMTYNVKKEKEGGGNMKKWLSPKSSFYRLLSSGQWTDAQIQHEITSWDQPCFKGIAKRRYTEALLFSSCEMSFPCKEMNCDISNSYLECKENCVYCQACPANFKCKGNSMNSPVCRYGWGN